MTSTGLDKLPPEVLATIIDHIETEDGWLEYPTETLLSLRLTCKALEHACHKLFLLYFGDWSIDLEREKDLSITKAVLASRVHRAAIEKITFVYRGEKPSLWQVAPLLNETLCSLITLNREVVLGFDPFGYSEQSDDISTENVLEFISMILIVVATSGLKIKNISIRARREDWDAYDHFFGYTLFFADEHHSTFIGIDYGETLAELHAMIRIGRQKFIPGAPPELVAEYPGIGNISLDYVRACLKMQGLKYLPLA